MDGAAIKLGVEIDLCGQGPECTTAALDPCDELLESARDPGLDYENVEATEIGDLSRQRKSLAVALHDVRLNEIYHLDEGLHTGPE